MSLYKGDLLLVSPCGLSFDKAKLAKNLPVPYSSRSACLLCYFIKHIALLCLVENIRVRLPCCFHAAGRHQGLAIALKAH